MAQVARQPVCEAQEAAGSLGISDNGDGLVSLRDPVCEQTGLPIDPAVNMNGDPICWPNDEKHQAAGLVGQMNGTATYDSPTTENVKRNDVEEWEIWNLSADAHPIHLHLVKFVLVGRKEIKLDSAANEYGEIEPEEIPLKQGDGTYYTEFALPLHDGSMGQGYFVENPTYGDDIDEATLIAQGYINNFDRDVITALPGQVTIIRAKFDKPGEFNWHCHILAHGTCV